MASAPKRDPMPGEGVAITIGGTTRQLRFKNRAQFELRRVAGYTVAEGLVRAGALDAEAFSHLIWAGRVGAGEAELEVDTVVEELDPAEYPHYLERITEAVLAAMPWMGQRENGTRKKKTRRSHGSPPGPKPAPSASTNPRSGSRLPMS